VKGAKITSSNGKVTTTLKKTQGIIKQVIEKGVEKVQAHITAETIEHIF
jgi:hypothetical protein